MYMVLKLPEYHPGWLARITRRGVIAVHSWSRPGLKAFAQKDYGSIAECNCNTELLAKVQH